MKMRPAGELKGAILKVLANGPVPVSGIYEAARPSSVDSAREALKRMLRQGAIRRVEHGVYALTRARSATPAKAPHAAPRPRSDGASLARLADRLAVLCRARGVAAESLALVDRAVHDTVAAIGKATP